MKNRALDINTDFIISDEYKTHINISDILILIINLSTFNCNITT